MAASPGLLSRWGRSSAARSPRESTGTGSSGSTCRSEPSPCRSRCGCCLTATAPVARQFAESTPGGTDGWPSLSPGHQRRPCRSPNLVGIRGKVVVLRQVFLFVLRILTGSSIWVDAGVRMAYRSIWAHPHALGLKWLMSGGRVGHRRCQRGRQVDGPGPRGRHVPSPLHGAQMLTRSSGTPAVRRRRPILLRW
jgi:hypothetical protein